ncbi:MAG: hypothetical protein R2817_13345 [Flavobacteriales bacterium]
MERTHPHSNGILMRGSLVLFFASLFTLVFLLSSCQRDELLSPAGNGQVDDNGGNGGGNGSDDPPGDDNGGGN